jgi:hypothetical protein
MAESEFEDILGPRPGPSGHATAEDDPPAE